MPDDIDQPDPERSKRDALTRGSPPEAYYGFDFHSVTWGYRELFKSKIDKLFAEGLLGEVNEKVTQVFFELIQQADRAHFDHVIRAFLSSLTPTNKWIMTIPALFEEWCRIGFDLASRHLYMGEKYFHAWRRETLGRTPAEVAPMLNLVRRLMSVDAELAYHFLKGCETLSGQVQVSEIEAFAQEAIVVYRRNRSAGLRFIALDLKSSKAYLREITRESRLDDLKQRLERMTCALAGRRLDVRKIGELGIGDVAPRERRVVCTEGALYLPERVREAESQEGNRGLHLLMAATSAACHAFDGFSRVHGTQGFASSLELIESEGIRPVRAGEALFRLVETRRIVGRMRREFPGLRRLIDFGAEIEFRGRPSAGWTDDLLRACIQDDGLETASGALREAFEIVDRVASRSRQFYDTAFEIGEALPKFLDCAYRCGMGVSPMDRGMGILPMNHGRDARATDVDPFAHSSGALRSLGFFPDFAFPVRFVSAAESAVAVDLRDRSAERREGGREETVAVETGQESEAADGTPREDVAPPAQSMGTGDGAPSGEEERVKPGIAGYFYDEWNGLDQDYYEDWCCLREIRPRCPVQPPERLQRLADRARRVRAIFEQLKPDESRREKRLTEGDEIDIDPALEFVAMRRARQSPKIDFYIRPRIKQRSLATALVIDLSGSTAEACAPGESGRKTGPRVIEQEREAAFILAEGLESLGDQFGIFGFTGSGRERCEFMVFKDFDEKWGDEPVGRLMTVQPGSSTRMGVALRHAGWKLRQTPALRRLIVIITDGKPMDSGYDPASRYAQYDVRKACEENLFQEIATFCISTLENTRADLELMFPRKRFLVIEDMQQLPALLSRFYLKLTKA
ncbi:hypothetical protein JW916_07340 [Candidatus Sumerlaeota bacterium]|nr:hypothetical protein [Candidatus Sumerlaeota bacterium]